MSGAINITRHLDISESQEYTLTLVANDGKWEAQATMKIYVHEAEERDPRFNQNTYKFSVLENVAGAVVGQVSLHFTIFLKAGAPQAESEQSPNSESFEASVDAIPVATPSIRGPAVARRGAAPNPVVIRTCISTHMLA